MNACLVYLEENETVKTDKTIDLETEVKIKAKPIHTINTIIETVD